MGKLVFVLSLALAGCAHETAAAGKVVPASAPMPAEKATAYRTSTIALPGGTADGIGMDYLLFDPRTKAVWAPAGNTASVDVVDTATGKVTRIEGFATKEIERQGRKRTMGPSAASLGEGVVYLGNRGDQSVCAFDDTKLAKRGCAALDSMPDGVLHVAATKEVWVTTPRDNSIRVLDGATLEQKAKLTFEGRPEGFAADAKRGRFYTNLEDRDRTLAIDLVSRKTVAGWSPGKCPAAVKDAVKAKYPDAKIVSCKKEKARYEVRLSNKKELDVSADGSVLQTEEKIDVASVPAAVTSAFEAKYSGTKAARAEKQTKADGAVTYELAFEKGGKKHEATFWEDGKFKEEE